MCERFQVKLQQTTQALGILATNQRLLVNHSADNDLFDLLSRFVEQRQRVKQLENQIKCVSLKTKSQSQQIQDERQRRLNTVTRATRLRKTIQQIYDIINYRGQHTSPIDQLHYIKKICEDRLRDDTYSDNENDDDDEELDSRNCTIDDDQNESIIIHPRVVLPQSSSKKRLYNADQDSELNPSISPSKRLRFDESSILPNPPSQRIIAQTTFECYTSISSSSSENTTRPFVVSTDIQMIDHSSDLQRARLTISSDDTLTSSSTLNSTKTASSSSMEQTLPTNSTKLANVSHRFISRKIFKPETCFVCLKRINFGSVSYRCSYCSQSSHVNCKENAGSTCKSTLLTAPLPPHSPKTPLINTFQQTHRQRMVNSEPRQKVPTSVNPSTIQRRLPFERMMLHKTSSHNANK